MMTCKMKSTSCCCSLQTTAKIIGIVDMQNRCQRALRCYDRYRRFCFHTRNIFYSTDLRCPVSSTSHSNVVANRPTSRKVFCSGVYSCGTSEKFVRSYPHRVYSIRDHLGLLPLVGCLLLLL
ncbi:hypothetical protein OUZ56_001483 [Daphnia magna]|uniref:Uncharacterized protein n=1 Tax=Daphnia magna TaxID=35525 RepID=A0ABR0A3D4_9CRUS|nr:hypothetical protein OUZ56_001483 [Daphnia magna]